MSKKVKSNIVRTIFHLSFICYSFTCNARNNINSIFNMNSVFISNNFIYFFCTRFLKIERERFILVYSYKNSTDFMPVDIILKSNMFIYSNTRSVNLSDVNFAVYANIHLFSTTFACIAIPSFFVPF